MTHTQSHRRQSAHHGAPVMQTLVSSVDMLDPHVFEIGVAWDGNENRAIMAGGAGSGTPNSKP